MNTTTYNYIIELDKETSEYDGKKRVLYYRGAKRIIDYLLFEIQCLEYKDTKEVLKLLEGTKGIKSIKNVHKNETLEVK